MTYTVRTPFLFWFGIIAFAGSIILAISVFGNWIAMFMLISLFGSCGAGLFLMSARVTGDVYGLTVKRLHRQSTVSWSDLTAVETGGGNLVFTTAKGRVVAPSLEFWRGQDKAPLVALLCAKLDERGIGVLHTLRAVVAPDDR